MQNNTKSKNQNQNIASLYVVQAGLIAAIYFCLNFVSSSIGLAYGPVQLRLSEALTLLPALMPAAIPGLTIGCALANIASPYGLADIIIGSAATLLAAILTRATRNIKFKNMPLLSALMPVLCNGIIVGAEVAYFTTINSGARLTVFLLTMGEIALGELVSMILALLLYKALEKRI